jgi:hypothetical protein
MATKDETNTSELPAFSSLKAFEQMAIILKCEGQPADKIANMINAEYNLTYKMMTIREWFWADGRLFQAYHEYNTWHADQVVNEAKLLIKKSTGQAAQTLVDLLDPKIESSVRHNAGKTLLNKFIPDRQVILDPNKVDELPTALAKAGDDVVTGGEETDGPKPLDDASQGAGADGTPGA